MTVYYNGRQDALDRLEAAVVNLQVNVLEGMISAHRAATVSPKELERARDAIASGAPREGRDHLSENSDVPIGLGRGASEGLTPRPSSAEGDR